MKALYRIAEKQNKYDRNKPVWINNGACFTNFIKSFDGDLTDDLIVFGDRLEESLEVVEDTTYKEIAQHGNAQSFREVFQYALDNFKDDEIVYFVEDDYIHRPGFVKAIEEGLEKVQYVTMYDHPDKYNGTERLLFHTASTHWQLVPSTTMTFASKVQTLREDKEVFMKYTEGNHPHDHYIFLELGKRGRMLASPIPGYSTHGVTEFLAPVIDWQSNNLHWFYE